MSGSPRFVIIGAGPAGMRAVEVLRRGAPEADILLIGDEPHLPYQRPPLSKAFITGRLAESQLYLNPAGFYADNRIRLKLGCAAVRIDRIGKSVELADGERASYDKLLLATGCRCRRLGAGFDGLPIHYLRTLADAQAIKQALVPGARVVIIGGGFIGLELAASATKLGARVTVVEAAPRLMMRAMPPVISDFARALHERHGVRFEFDARIKRIETTPDAPLTVTTDLARYDCDLLIAGIGAEPNTALAEAAGLDIDDGIRVDRYGRTSDPDIFAAGDATRHDNPLLGRAIRVESWQVALNQAAVVARVMLGASEAYAELPWLWTDQYDCNIQVLGMFDAGQELVVRGDPEAQSFTVLGLDADSRVAAAITVNTGRDMALLRRLTSSRARVPKALLADSSHKLSEILKGNFSS
jgi:anthranilate 1,2-dioxygenase ferredoxin reductase subunit